MTHVILHGSVFTPAGILEDGAVWMDEGKILAVEPAAGFSIPPSAEITDATGMVVAPGLIDTHTHGGTGFDYMTCTPGELKEILAWLPSTGVTCVLPTLASCYLAEGLEMVRRLAAAQRESSPGSAVIGRPAHRRPLSEP